MKDSRVGWNNVYWSNTEKWKEGLYILLYYQGGGNYKIVVFLEKFFDDINVISWTLPYIAEGSSLQASNNSMWLGTPQKS